MSSKARLGRPKYPLTLNHSNNATTISSTDNLNGILIEAIIQPPSAVDSSATLTINIKDSDSVVIYTKGSIAASASPTIDLLTADTRVPICGPITVEAVYSASQTADRVATVALLIDRG